MVCQAAIFSKRFEPVLFSIAALRCDNVQFKGGYE